MKIWPGRPWGLEWRVGPSQLSCCPSLCLPFCPGAGEPRRDGWVEVSSPYSLGKVAMLFLVGDCYSCCLSGSQRAPNRPRGPLGIASPWDLAASFNLPPVDNKRLRSSTACASLSHIVAALARLWIVSSVLICVPTVGAWGHDRIHLTTNIPLENLELLGPRQMDVEWGVGAPPYFFSLLRKHRGHWQAHWQSKYLVREKNASLLFCAPFLTVGGVRGWIVSPKTRYVGVLIFSTWKYNLIWR